MKRISTTVVAALTAFVLTSCNTATEQTAPAHPQTSQAEPAHEESNGADPSAASVQTDGPRAAERLDQLLTTLSTVYRDECDTPFATLAEYRDCNPDDPAAYLESIESPQPGELIVTLLPDAWGGGEYDPDQVFTVPYLSGNLFSYIGRHTDELQMLTTITPDGAHQDTEGRMPQSENPDAPSTEAELQYWADARFHDWLYAMDITYRNLCGGVESVADYRACVPDDPHGYITEIKAPAAGELVVNVENGPWQGGTYDMPGADFMSGNMLIKIAYAAKDVDSLTVKTADGHSHSTDWNPGHATYYQSELQPGHL